MRLIRYISFLGVLTSYSVAFGDLSKDLSQDIGDQTFFGCEDGVLQSTKEGARLSHWNLEQGKVYHYCFFLPRNKPAAKKHPLVEIQVTNLGNAQCSDLEMIIIRPNAKTIFGSKSRNPRASYSRGSQPGAVNEYTPGKWRMLLRLNEGCSRYTINAVFAK